MEKIIDLFDGIKLHFINTDKFKTDLMAVFMFTDLNRNDITKNALIPAVLRRGTANLNTMKDISIKLENMYGSVFDASSDKTGDRQTIQFYINSLNNEYALDSMNIQSEALDLLCDVILNPKLNNGYFDETYVSQEKDALKELIESRINDKAYYANTRCIEEMYKGEPYGLYKFGYIEDLENINAENLYKQYIHVLETAEIHIYFSGVFDSNKVCELLKSKFSSINRSFKECNKSRLVSNKVEGDKYITDNQDVTQGKLVLGYRVENVDLISDLEKMILCSSILGGTPGSKLFQNVREKASLAYTVRASYTKHKGIMLVSAGIEIDKYDEAHALILKQVEDMKNGNITDEEVADAKSYLINSYKSYFDDQSSTINFSMGQELLGVSGSIDEMIDKINKVTKDDVIEVANKLKLQTTYFLTK